MQRMRIVLQQREGNLYFKDIGAWTPDPSEAMDFVSSSAVVEFCELNKIDGVQVVLKFEDEKYEIVLPEAIPQRRAAERAAPSA
jgi:hypothetical protein